jgi:predicted metal-dependent phosphotriesterase family hydrolase
MPPQALRIFAQSLLEAGISEDDIGVMIRTNPAKLLGL